MIITHVLMTHNHFPSLLLDLHWEVQNLYDPS